MGKGNKRSGRKRAYAEDDELDPMDPSSYSDAPRGGWYVWIFDLTILLCTSQKREKKNSGIC